MRELAKHIIEEKPAIILSMYFYLIGWMSIGYYVLGYVLEVEGLIPRTKVPFNITLEEIL